MPPQPNKSILCVIDFSDASLQAIRWAIPEAKEHSMHMSILYPYRLDQLQKKGNVVSSKKAIEEEAFSKFERKAAGLLREQQVSFDFRAEVGFIRDRIQEHVRTNNVALLVIGKGMAMGNVESFEEQFGEIDVPLVIVSARRG